VRHRFQYRVPADDTHTLCVVHGLPLNVFRYAPVLRDWEISINRETDGRHGIVNQMYEAVVNGRRASATGPWGMATVEVLLAVLESARERRQVFLSHQAPLPR
jgi:SH3-like domain-containing protein